MARMSDPTPAIHPSDNRPSCCVDDAPRVGDVINTRGEIDDSMPQGLRDVVRGQVLALLSAETTQGVLHATNALRDAVAATESDEDHAEESDVTDRLLALCDRPEVQSLIAMAVPHLFPSPPTPNLTVTGAPGTLVWARNVGANDVLVTRVIGASGVVNVVVPKSALVISISPSEKAPGAGMPLDFTEESHSLDAAVMLKSVTPPAETPVDPAAGA